MLEEKDFEKIGEIVKIEVKSEVTAAVKMEFESAEKRIVENVVKEVVGQVVDALDQNIMPTLDKILEKVDTIERTTEKALGKSVARDKILDRKVEMFADTLVQRKTITISEGEGIRQMQVFARENL